MYIPQKTSLIAILSFFLLLLVACSGQDQQQDQQPDQQNAEPGEEASASSGADTANDTAAPAGVEGNQATTGTGSQTVGSKPSGKEAATSAKTKAGSTPPSESEATADADAGSAQKPQLSISKDTEAVEENQAQEEPKQEASSPTPQQSYDPMAKKYEGKLPEAKSVVGLCRQQAFTQLKTYAPNLDDKSVSVTGLDPWTAKKAEYAGRYKGPLDGELTELSFSIDQYGHLLGRVSYQIEEVTEAGMLEPKRGQVKMDYSKINGTILVWPKLEKINEQEGQFVEWTNQAGELQHGFITYSDPNKKAGYTLLRKME